MALSLGLYLCPVWLECRARVRDRIHRGVRLPPRPPHATQGAVEQLAKSVLRATENGCELGQGESLFPALE